MTNLSDNFKIIHSEDFTITDSENNAIIVNAKRPIVIAPKTTKKIGLLAESKSFKLYDIKIGLKQLYTTGPAISIFKTSLFNLLADGVGNSKLGPLEITRTKCNVYPNGTTRAFFKLTYTGSNFLGINGSKAMMLTAHNKKAYFNIAQKSKTTFFPSEKEAMTLMLEFENAHPNLIGENCDKVSFENVFSEYELKSNNNPVEFHIYKKEMKNGDDAPKEKKENRKHRRLKHFFQSYFKPGRIIIRI